MDLLNKKQAQDHEIVSQREIKKEIKLIGSHLRKPGHILWKFNTKETKLSRAEFHKQDVVLDFTKANPAKAIAKSSKVMVEENCIYFQALNEKNAIKVLRRNKLIK